MTVLVWTTLLLALGVMLLLALGAGYLLGLADKIFHVHVDPRLEAATAALPGANCAGCGFVGCAAYAEAVVLKGAPVNKCNPGGAPTVAKLARVMGVDAKETWPYRPVVHCGATLEDRLQRRPYRGEQTCGAANMISGVQGCTFGCLGLGDCVVACDYGAMRMMDGLAVVDYVKCTGCGVCARACPRKIITMIPFKADRVLALACSNKDLGNEVKAVCKVGCIGCRGCVRRSPRIFHVPDNHPRINYEEYTPAVDVTEVLEKCPGEVLIYVGKPTLKDLAKTAGEELPEVVKAKPESTVDKTEWQG